MFGGSKRKKCKCVDYYKENNNYFVKQKIIGNTPTEIRCNKYAQKGSDFCEEHKNCKQFLKQFTNGEEPELNYMKWAHPYVEGSHNCYAYFLNDIYESLIKKCEDICYKTNGNCPNKPKKCRNLIPQPGDYYLEKKYGDLSKKEYNYTCEEMEDKILKDNPNISKTQLTEKCERNHYKGAMVVDPGSTFHFYRQNPNGTWSHKPGTLKVSEKDAANNTIYTPMTANRDYTSPSDPDAINYTGFCGYYCIPKNITTKSK
tara:strand:- start:1072 stop:1845 length:774 start_codon:yes stop_codon:yes gene_type:complete